MVGRARWSLVCGRRGYRVGQSIVSPRSRPLSRSRRTPDRARPDTRALDSRTRRPAAGAAAYQRRFGCRRAAGSFNVQFGDAAAISPDGAVLAFIAQEDDRDPQLYVRRLTQLQAAPLLGTDNALGPFFSPDGQWIGFFAGGKLKKIAVTGGAAVTLCRCAEAAAAARGARTTRLCSRPTRRRVRLLRVSSAGGKAEPLTSLAEGEVIQLWPQVLPGGKAVLYTSEQHHRRLQRRGPRRAVAAGRRAEGCPAGGYHGRYLRAVIWSTSTTGRSLRRLSISTGWR